MIAVDGSSLKNKNVRLCRRPRRRSVRNTRFAPIDLVQYSFTMSTATAKLLSEFEALPVEQQQEFLREVMNHLPPWDSGPLSDDAVATAGDALAAMLHQEERAS